MPRASRPHALAVGAAPPRRPLWPWRLLTLPPLAAALLLAIPAAPAALAAPPKVTLAVAAASPRRVVSLCGHSPALTTDVHRGARLVVHGFVRPSPGARPFRVLIRVKHCIRNTFRKIREFTVAGRADGSFRTSIAFRTAGAFTVRAYFDTRSGHRVGSAKRFVLVR